MAYSYLNFAQAKTQLSEMLGDTGEVYYQDAEIGIYIQESLRTWGAASMYWRERGVFNTSANQPFYLLQNEFPALLAYTVTDTQLMTEIQYQLLEPATGTSWTGSDQFSFDQITNAMQRRRNQFMVETGAVLNHPTSGIAPLPFGRFPLDDTVIDVRRAAFQPVGGADWVTLWRQDEWSMGANTAMTWPQTPATPQAYSIAASPPVTLQLEPPPNINGTLDMVTVEDPGDLDPSSPNGTLLFIPDDFVWVVKFGVLADLLGADGQARDQDRAQYCLQRWQEGIQLANIYTSIIQLQLNDVPLYVCSLQELDSGSYNWRNTTGTPTVGALAGLNLLVLAGDGSSGGIPDGVYGVSADVVRSAPVPVADSDLIQVGREELDSILRYAEHLAAWKMAGTEFMATMPHYQGFMRGAMLYNNRLRANARNFNVLKDRATLEDSRRPRKLEPVGA